MVDVLDGIHLWLKRSRRFQCPTYFYQSVDIVLLLVHFFTPVVGSSAFSGRLFFSHHCDPPYLKIKYASQLNHIGIIIVVVRGYHFPRAYLKKIFPFFILLFIFYLFILFTEIAECGTSRSFGIFSPRMRDCRGTVGRSASGVPTMFFHDCRI